jgi:hypothetical protein
MAGALAERLAGQGHDVTYVTPQNMVSAWTVYTDEQGFVQAQNWFQNFSGITMAK